MNSRISGEVKEYSRQVLEELGEDTTTTECDTTEKVPDNVAKGHKAALSNQRVLRRRNIRGKFSPMNSTPTYGSLRSVMGGHKAALNNPRVSEKTKDHSRHVLEEHDTI